jgi:hypothetical protein
VPEARAGARPGARAGGGGREALAVALAACGVRVGFEASADRPFTGSLARYLSAIGGLIGTDDAMIAASYGFQTVTSRMAAVVLTGATALGGAPRVELATLRWRPLPGMGGVAVGVVDDALIPMAPSEAMAMVITTTAAWAEAVRGAARIARRLLWGDAAASVAAALRRCTWAGFLPAGSATALLAQFEAAAPARALVVPRSVDGHPTFQRQTCCLLTKAGGLGMCEECSFLAPERFAAAQRATRLSFERGRSGG